MLTETVNQATNDDSTALMFASEKGNVEVVVLLVAAGAAVDQTDHNGHTALYHANKNGHDKVVERLSAEAAVDQAAPAA
jgi:ankyrin repeat protein